jgi:PAS domain S-box-containing protein
MQTTSWRTDDAEFAELLARSHLALIGRRFVPDEHRGLAAAEWLYEAPFGLLAHDTSPDPLFLYANRRAQRLFGYHLDEFIGLPSRLSAGQQDRRSREALMDQVHRHGYAQGYRGPRVTKDGRPFWIENVTIWNLVVPGGPPAGQAAIIRDVTYGTGGRPKVSSSGDVQEI